MNSLSLVASLCRRIDEVLRPLIPGGAACALVEFPDYANVGDSAIWLGQRRWLRRSGIRTAYASTMATYDRDVLAARVGSGVILLQGGGNLGDLWQRHQQFRERVIADFPEHRIIQLPQTITFQNLENLRRARAVFNAHPNLTLLVRDRRSLELARNEFRVTSLLCPDMAFLLGTLRRPAPPQVEVLWLARSDKESRGAWPRFDKAGAGRLDWRVDEVSGMVTAARFLTQQIAHRGRAVRPAWACQPWLFDVIAQQRLTRGCRILTRGRVVVTDRLHGHILCLLMGIPHVILDTAFGKIRAFYDTRTAGCALTHWAHSAEEALAKATTLVSGLVGGRVPAPWR
jgi:pyruvyl transferase EpsO